MNNEKLRFIDNHTHGAFGINFNYCSYDEALFVLKELYKRNIKAICPTLVGESIENIQRQLALLTKIKKEQLNFENNSLVLGVHLEGSFLNPEKSGIQDKNCFMKPTVDNFINLAGEYKNIIKIVTLAPESDEGLIDYLNENNIVPQAGHTIGNDLKNVKGTTHHFNAMPNLHHRNTSITLKGLIDDSIYTEIIADLFHVEDDMLKLFFKIKPKNKILLVSDSLPCAHYDKDIIFCNKKINSKGMDENNTIAGSIKTLDEICNNLIQKNILNENDIKQTAYINQIEYIKPENAEVDILLK